MKANNQNNTKEETYQIPITIASENAYDNYHGKQPLQLPNCLNYNNVTKHNKGECHATTPDTSNYTKSAK